MLFRSKHLDTVHSEIDRHCQDVENKMVTIISEVINSELSRWEARPPVPSTHLKNVSRSIVTFREAIAPMLTQKQVKINAPVTINSKYTHHQVNQHLRYLSDFCPFCDDRQSIPY